VRRRCFSAMGTAWCIAADLPGLLPAAEARVRAAEAALSRFREDSALSRLNRQRRVTDPLLAAVVRAALHLRARTAGAFDPAVGAAMLALGYDRSFERLPRRGGAAPDHRRPRIAVAGATVRLDGAGCLDLGGIAKGYTVDRVAAWLQGHGARRVLVDGGGDLRASPGVGPIGAGPGLGLRLDGRALATSSTRKRSWEGPDGRRHHVVDPATACSADSGLATATVLAPDATTADALATALLVDPRRVLPRLADLDAVALVEGSDGTWWQSAALPEVA